MSCYNGGVYKLCGPEGNGCLCAMCIYRKASKRPEACYCGGCMDCDPDRTEPDTAEEFGPILECPAFTRRQDI